MNIKNKFCINKKFLLFLFLVIFGTLTTIFAWNYLSNNSVKTKAVKYSTKYTYLSLASIRTDVSYKNKDKIFYKNAIEYFSNIVSRIGQEGANLVIMPEFTFYFKDSYISSVKKNVKTQEYDIIVNENNIFYSEIVNTFKNLAAKYHVNIFLTSFPLNSNTLKEPNVGFFINDQGKIIGYKIKYEPPVGKFDINLAGKKFKILPLICGEAFNFNNPDDSNTKSWVSTNAPYDIIIHALNQADVDFSYLATYIQNSRSNIKSKEQNVRSRLSIDWYKEAFYNYYQPYFDYLSNNPGVVIVSDTHNIAGIFNKNLNKINSYKMGVDYDIAGFKINNKNFSNDYTK